MSPIWLSPPTRREALRAAASLGFGAAAAAAWPEWLVAQVPAGKDARLIRHSVSPPDYETPVALLDSFVTPADRFYVRCHMPLPARLDAASWTLEIDGSVDAPQKLSLDELRRMPSTTVTVTLECAGNGRAFFDPPVAGIQWKKGAVGTARWTGVRLRDLLARVGARSSGAFVLMNGADVGLGTMPDYVRQVPMAKAMHEDTVIAWEMNGQAIPPLHGFPLRAIIPGWEGAYAVKWLTSLRVVDREFDGFWVATAYRYPTRFGAPGAAVDAKDMAPLTGLPIKSLITQPLDGATLAPGRIAVAGWAWAGEDDVARVEVSTDNGATWQSARLTGAQAKYAWRRFEFSFDAARPGSMLILSRAADTSGRVQPTVPPWNPSGYLWNPPDDVRITVGS
jgi:DMSO/TMAO reductase YedYZ molybdopterin-dependent catalytic subunit